VKVLIADPFEQTGIDALAAAGCDVSYQPEVKGEGLVAAVRDTTARVLVVRSTPVPAPVLEAGALALVVRAGAGVNTIDVDAASRRGVYVSNCPGRNAIAVAELTWGLILALDRRIPDTVAELRAGRWNKKEFSRAGGLHGRTLGLLGYGHIGVEVARRGHAFGMPIVVWSRRLSSASHTTPSDVPVQVAGSPAEVAERANVLSLHLALAAETRGIVGAEVLERLRPGSILVNTARAELVDHEALAHAVRARGIRVGVDVHADEPTAATGEYSSPLLSLPGVYGTHHIGASTLQAQESIASETVRIIVTYLRTGRVPNVVNLATTTPATHRLVVRHLDRPGVLADVFDRLRRARLNVQETENVIFAGAEAAVARIDLDGQPEDALLRAMREGNRDILDLHVVTI
jgi:D-3-phosphoglycerate dehydrogenase